MKKKDQKDFYRDDVEEIVVDRNDEYRQKKRKMEDEEVHNDS